MSTTTTHPKVPENVRILHTLRYRLCAKKSCKTCQEGTGHPPVWYAYWKINGHLYRQCQDEYRVWDLLEARRRQNKENQGELYQK